MMTSNELLLDEAKIREIVSRWFPVSEESLKFAYNGDIREVARDFAYHISAAQLAQAKPIIEKQEREKIIDIVKDYFNLDWVEFRSKYPWVKKAGLPGGEILQALKQGEMPK